MGEKSLAFLVLLYHQQFSTFIQTSRFGFNLIQERRKVLTRGQNLKDLKCQSERNNFVINQVQAWGVLAMTFFSFSFFYIIQILRHLHNLVAQTTLLLWHCHNFHVWHLFGKFLVNIKVVLPSGQGHVRSSSSDLRTMIAVSIFETSEEQHTACATNTNMKIQYVFLSFEKQTR